jgi:hypothetical protein
LSGNRTLNELEVEARKRGINHFTGGTNRNGVWLLSHAAGVVKDLKHWGGCDLGQGALRALIFPRRKPP